MKITIVSDTHDNYPKIKKVVDWSNKEKIKVLLHCGDICLDDTMEEIKYRFKGKAYFVKGNGDFGLDIPEKGALEVEGKKIGLCHFKEIGEELCKTGKYDIVFYGHTHKPWEEKVGGCRLVNPGDGAGIYQKPTFAVYDTETGSLELKILELL